MLLQLHTHPEHATRPLSDIKPLTDCIILLKHVGTYQNSVGGKDEPKLHEKGRVEAVIVPFYTGFTGGQGSRAQKNLPACLWEGLQYSHIKSMGGADATRCTLFKQRNAARKTAALTTRTNDSLSHSGCGMQQH